MWKNLLRGVSVAALALLVGMLAHYAWDATHRDVPDRPAAPLVEDTPKRWTAPASPDQLNDSPARGTVPTSTTVPAPVKAADTSRVEPTHDVSVPDYRPPAQPDAPDYRTGRILEPYPEDDLESQRQRAYARCVYGQQDDAAQVAYCDRWYGPDSGYQG